jgi:DNA-binding MarR family transcriptional regulator
MRLGVGVGFVDTETDDPARGDPDDGGVQRVAVSLGRRVLRVRLLCSAADLHASHPPGIAGHDVVNDKRNLVEPATAAVDGGAIALAERGVFLLSQLGYHVAQRCAELLAPLDIHPAHYGVLMHLATSEGPSQQQLADTLGIHRNVMVGLIDELEDRGLVRRERDLRDRRAHQIHLTDRAHGLLGEANNAVDGLEDEIFAGFDADEHVQLVAVLHRAVNQAKLPTGIHPGLRRRRQ